MIMESDRLFSPHLNSLCYNHLMEKISMPDNVKTIIDQLQAAGYEAYCVGGCVRDSLLGRTPGDWDITTNALPADIKQIFHHTIDTGIRHGTVTVLIYPERSIEALAGILRGDTGASESKHQKPDTYEVTTFRIDGQYADSRHPDHVTFTASLREDLCRRDFTINAMAYNETAGLVDLFGGQEDLARGLIRCVGDPDERFDEDALRILRAVRFAAQLGFSIESGTKAAITGHAQKLDLVSKERIYVELNKLLCSGHMEKVQDLFDLGLAGHIAGGFESIKALGPGTDAPLDPENPELCLPSISTDKRYQRYALSFRGDRENNVKKLLLALKSDLDTVKHAGFAAPLLLTPLPSDPYAFKKLISTTDVPHFRELLEMKQSISRTEEYRECCAQEDVNALIELLDGILEREEPITLKDLVVTGKDLLDAGIRQGPEIGTILNSMLDDVLHEPVHNSILYLFSKHVCRQ